MKRPDHVRSIANVARLLAVVVIVGVLYFARDIFIPLALGLLLSFLLSPVVNRLQRLGVPNTLAVISTAMVTFILLAGGLAVLGQQLSEFVYDLPQFKEELKTKARSLAGITSGMDSSLGNLATEVTEAIQEADNLPAEKTADASDESEEKSPLQQFAARIFPVEEESEPDKTHDGKTPKSPLYVQTVGEQLPLSTWAATAGTLLGPLASVGLVTVFALFMLVYRESLRDRIIFVISHGKYVTTTEALDEVATRISRYLVAQTIINSSYGFVMVLGLMVIGATLSDKGFFPNAILWGVLATGLRFVPYVGPVIGALFPLAISLVVFPGYTVFLAVLGLIAFLELTSNNIIEPWLYGTSTGISAIAVITAAVFWGWLWGPVGLLLSTPLTVCLVVLGRHVPGFRYVNTLLGEDVQINPALRLYQRLLAGDRHRAKETMNAFLLEKGPDNACDLMLIPALKRLRADHEADDLSDERFTSLYELTSELTQEIPWNRDEPPAIAPTQDEPADTQGNAGEDLSESDSESSTSANHALAPLVIGCPSHHPSENILLHVMQARAGRKWHMDLLSEDEMPTEIGSTIADQNPAVAVIMVLPQGGFPQARFLCRIIRGQGYRGPIIVACMGKFKHHDRLLIRFRKAGASHMTTSFSQTCAKVESYLQPKKPSPHRHGPHIKISQSAVDVPVK